VSSDRVVFSEFGCSGSAVLRVPRDQENKESRATIQPRISTPCAVDTETDDRERRDDERGRGEADTPEAGGGTRPGV